MTVLVRRLFRVILRRDFGDVTLRPIRAEELRRRAWRVLDELR